MKVRIDKVVKVYNAWYDEEERNLMHEVSAQEIDGSRKGEMLSLKLEKRGTSRTSRK